MKHELGGKGDLSPTLFEPFTKNYGPNPGSREVLGVVELRLEL